MQIAVVGTGYVGLVSGACLAEVGHTVVCVDKDKSKIACLERGETPIFEPGLTNVLKRNVEHERLSFTTELARALPRAECVFIAVGTPQDEDGSADLTHVINVAREIGKLADHDLLVIVKSTVPVGTCDKVEAVLQEEIAGRGVKHKLSVASNPEFLKEGTAIEDFMKPDRIVCGVANQGAAELFNEMYKPLVLDDPGKLMITDRRSSELTKYGANAMLATRISFMNELARLCEEVGANVDQVRLGIGADPRIGRKFLYAGPGYGGSCFPKDVSALLHSGDEYCVDLHILKAVKTANEAQKRFATDKVVAHFAKRGGLAGKKIAVWGLAFKPGTDDVRESPAKTVIETLLASGAEVAAHDPEAAQNFAREVGDSPKLNYVNGAYDALKGADALVLVTEWTEYRRPNWQKAAELMRGKVVFDLRNQYSYDVLRKLDFQYYCVGRPQSPLRQDPKSCYRA